MFCKGFFILIMDLEINGNNHVQMDSKIIQDKMTKPKQTAFVIEQVRPRLSDLLQIPFGSLRLKGGLGQCKKAP